MKSYFDDPALRIIRFEARDVLADSQTETELETTDEDELIILP